MAAATKRPGPDLRPWDQALAQRVQPVLSALFHDVMSPLTLLKNRVFLVERQLRSLSEDPEVPDQVKAELGLILDLLAGVEASANRVYRGMTVPRDAIWATILEGKLFDPAVIAHEIGRAMRADEPAPSEASQAGPDPAHLVSGTA